ncbi:heavy metal-associated isoprenylated plant protein 6-like [Phragmites australis]|uniref:heavy metal-associated isoprenylated plant protein 6-like n=1 Tax=Phragmites australis TaxID=29695 RepID=UPI002D799AB7|nr:heavy metal-associated isoprenylated plant protein 6-like [Phragmites australis]
MADKISTIVLKVDLECERCYKKIRRVLCKIQDKLGIKTISFDEKSNAVKISGPFDAEKVCKKLCCKAGWIIKEMNIKGKEESKDKDGGDKPKAAKPAEKDAGKPEKVKDAKPDKEAAKAGKKEAKVDKEAKPDKEKTNKDAKPEKKVKFELDDAAPASTAKPGKAMPMPAGMSKADLAPLLEKMMASKAGPEPPRGEPIMPPMMMVPPVPASQGVAVPSIWPAPAGSVSGYSYNAGYEPSSYYGGGYGCGCGGYQYCRCSKPAAPGGYYGVPVYDNQGWHYGGGQQPYYHQQQQQPCCEDPNAGCSVM